MGLKSALKQTEIGAIPEDWDLLPLGSLCMTGSGTTPSRALGDRYYRGGTIPWVKTLDLNNSDIEATEECVTPVALKETSLKIYPAGSVLVAMYGGFNQIGRTGLLRIPATVNQALTAIRPSTRLRPEYLLRVLNFRVDHWKSVASSSRKDPNITSNDIRSFLLPVPRESDQEAIAQALSDADALVASLERLLAKKRAIKQGATQALITGARRLPGFKGSWCTKRIADVATPCAERNTGGDPLPVLTCSKHLGFVESLRYFRNQVFSKDTTGYKIIRRGQIGYPANHIEEGSIGLQELYEVALVSPIYVVFSVNEQVNNYFLHRLLKLDSYRQRFATATSASVDRRGSLRWPAFSEILINLPSFEEQCAIKEVLSTMDLEIIALERRLEKARLLKRGMAQELLTGRIRLT